MEEHMGMYNVTLGEKVWTAGHCHKCAHMELTLGPVTAKSRADAVEHVRQLLCGRSLRVKIPQYDLVARLSITPDDSLFTSRSVKVTEV
jgi:hypothetical protein